MAKRTRRFYIDRWRADVLSNEDLSATTKVLACAFAEEANYATGRDCYPGNERLAFLSSLSLRAVVTHTANLEAAGYIKSVGPRGNNRSKRATPWALVIPGPEGGDRPAWAAGLSDAAYRWVSELMEGYEALGREWEADGFGGVTAEERRTLPRVLAEAASTAGSDDPAFMVARLEAASAAVVEAEGGLPDDAWLRTDQDLSRLTEHHAAIRRWLTEGREDP